MALCPTTLLVCVERQRVQQQVCTVTKRKVSACKLNSTRMNVKVSVRTRQYLQIPMEKLNQARAKMLDGIQLHDLQFVRGRVLKIRSRPPQVQTYHAVAIPKLFRHRTPLLTYHWTDQQVVHQRINVSVEKMDT